MKGATKYIIVFLITCAIFGTAWFVSSYLNARKFAELQQTQDQISIGILSSETEFDLLKDKSCDASAMEVFSDDLANLADKIAFSEEHFANPAEIATLKQQYTLLEIRDFLLTKRVAERCKQTPSFIFYFYGTKDDCPDCTRQGYVLDALRTAHPDVRIYAFDYNLELDTIKALRSIYKVGDTIPALVVNGVTYSGYQTLEQLQTLLKRK